MLINQKSNIGLIIVNLILISLLGIKYIDYCKIKRVLSVYKTQELKQYEIFSKDIFKLASFRNKDFALEKLEQFMTLDFSDSKDIFRKNFFDILPDARIIEEESRYPIYDLPLKWDYFNNRLFMQSIQGYLNVRTTDQGLCLDHFEVLYSNIDSTVYLASKFSCNENIKYRLSSTHENEKEEDKLVVKFMSKDLPISVQAEVQVYNETKHTIDTIVLERTITQP